MIEDEEIERINETELKNLAINCYSCLKEEGKKINYMAYIKQMMRILIKKQVKNSFRQLLISVMNLKHQHWKNMESTKKNSLM